jgi:chromosome partitioning protein
VNLATDLARRGRSVLLVDLEADMGASISLGVRPGDKDPSIYDLLLNQRRPTDAVRSISRVGNLHLVPGSRRWRALPGPSQRSSAGTPSR